MLTSFSRVGRLGRRVPDPRVKGKVPSHASRRLMDDHCGGLCAGENVGYYPVDATGCLH